MGILDFLLGRKADDPQRAERERQSKFTTLKTDGVRARNIGEWQYAARCFAEALRYSPDDAETQSYLAEAYIRIDDKEKAYPLLQKLSDLQPDNVSILLLLISTAASQQAWDVVASAGAKALALDDTDPRTYLIMAEAAHAREDHSEALALLDKAIALDPTLTAAVRLRARLHRHLGHLTQAQADALALVSLMPDSDEAHTLLGRIYELSDSPTEALASFEKARELNPFARKAIAGEVRIHLSAGRPDRAATLLDEAIAEMPDFIEAYRLRSRLYFDLGQEAAATADAQKADELTAAIAAQTEDYTNVANLTQQRYRDMNPYKF